jgi:hypothetical protein
MDKQYRFSVLALALATPLSSLAADVEFESTVPETCTITVSAPTTKNSILLNGGSSNIEPALVHVTTNSGKDRKVTISNVTAISGKGETTPGSGIYSRSLRGSQYTWMMKEVDVSATAQTYDFDYDNDVYDKSGTDTMSAGKKFAIAPALRVNTNSGTVKVSATLTAVCA